jgi:tetratricopeptide (TPR) repeat protein
VCLPAFAGGAQALAAEEAAQRASRSVPPAPYALVGSRLLDPVLPRATVSCVGPQAEASDPTNDSDTRACSALRAAASALARGRAPEASALALRAEDQAAGASQREALEQTAQLVRAEALARGRRTAEAQALFARLARTAAPPVSHVAEIRLADFLLDEGRAFEADEIYERRLRDPGSEPEHRVGWWLRAAEAALATKDPAAARGWLERAERSLENPEDRALVRLRLADALAAEGHADEAVAALSALVAEQGGADVALLAAARRATLEAGTSRTDLLDALEGVASATAPGVSTYGRVLLGGALLDDRRDSQAFAVLEPLANAEVPASLVPLVQRALARSLDALGVEAQDEAGCSRLLARAGDRFPSLARRAQRPDAVEALARCNARLGLVSRARQLYRYLVTEFGVEGRTRGLLPLAELELAAGETARARRHLDAEAQLSRDGDATLHLALLRGELALAEGRPVETVTRLLPLLQRRLSPRQSARALVALARAGRALADPTVVRDALEPRLLSIPTALGTDPDLGEAAFATAALLEGAGKSERARALFSRAERWLPSGPRRAEASYHTALLSHDTADAELAFGAAGDVSDAGAWSSLADAGRSALRARAALESNQAPSMSGGAATR